MKPSRYIRSGLAGLLLTFVLAACGGPSTPAPSGDTPGTDETQVIIPATTKIADPDTRAAMKGYDAGSGVLTFAQMTPALAGLAAGDVLVSQPSDAAPSGYLRKVVDVRQENGEVLLDTTQANLTDAVSQGDLTADFQLSGDDLDHVDNLPKGVTLTANPVPSGDLHKQVGVGENYGFTLNFDHTFIPIQNANATGTIRVDGGVNFNVGYGIEIGIHGPKLIPPRLPGVDNFQASVGFSQGSHLNITGDFQGVVGDSVLVGTQYFKPKIFLIGPVPVVLVPKVELYLTAGGEIKAHVKFSASESVTAQIGARWTKSEGWKDISGFGIDGQLPPPEFTGSLKPYVGAQSRASFTLYDVAGPEASLEGGVKLDVAYPRDPAWIIDAYLKGTLGFRVSLPILGTLADYQTTLFDISKELGRSVNAPPVLTLTSQPHSVNVGTPLNFRALCSTSGPVFANGEFYAVSDVEDGCPAVSANSDRDGPLTPDYTFTTPGDRTITAVARDSAGATTQVSFVLSVANPPPVLTLKYDGTPYQGAGYTISAVITDANAPSDPEQCGFTTWAVDAPDTLSGSIGCTQTVTFGAVGARQVRVSTHDRYGATDAKTVTLNVLPPPVNPYPVIRSAAVYTQGQDSNHVCQTYSVPGDTVMQLDKLYCLPKDTAPNWAQAVIDNPKNEALTYSWNLYVTTTQGESVLQHSDQALFNILDPYPGSRSSALDRCRVTLTVGAPDPSRTKTTTVWAGRCEYHTYSVPIK